MSDAAPGKRLADVLAALPTDLLDSIASITIEPGWPQATARLSVHRYGSTRYDVRQQSDGSLAATPRPAGPRDAKHEPPITAALVSRHDDIVMPITASDLWGQCVEVVRGERRLLGTAVAVERTVSDGPPELIGRISYCIVGWGQPRSAEREAWLARRTTSRASAGSGPPRWE